MPWTQRWPFAHVTSAQLDTQVPPTQYLSLSQVTPWQGSGRNTPMPSCLTHDWLAEHFDGNVTQSSGRQSPTESTHTWPVPHVLSEHESTHCASFACAGSGFWMHVCWWPLTG